MGVFMTSAWFLSTTCTSTFAVNALTLPNNLVKAALIPPAPAPGTCADALNPSSIIAVQLPRHTSCRVNRLMKHLFLENIASVCFHQLNRPATFCSGGFASVTKSATLGFRN
jgi:hypothetical protein